MLRDWSLFYKSSPVLRLCFCNGFGRLTRNYTHSVTTPYVQERLKSQDGDIIYRHPVESIELASKGYIVKVGGPTPSTIKTRILVNSGGLYSDRIAALLLPKHYGPGTENCIRYVKGHYYGLRGKPVVKRLIYPCPEKAARDNVTYLGVHCTLDMDGRLRFGPDALDVDRPDNYKIEETDDAHLTGFHAAIKRYLPSVRKEDLYPDYTGIRYVTLYVKTNCCSFEVHSCQWNIGQSYLDMDSLFEILSSRRNQIVECQVW